MIDRQDFWILTFHLIRLKFVKRLIVLSGALVLAVVWNTQFCLAQENSATTDVSRIERLIKDSKLDFKTINNFFKVTFSITNQNRQQVVYARQTIQSYNSLEGFEVFTICWDSVTAPSNDFLVETFSRSFKFGGLVYEFPSETQSHYRIRYRTMAFMDTTGDRLKDICEIVASTGDDLEKKLNPGSEDKF